MFVHLSSHSRLMIDHGSCMGSCSMENKRSTIPIIRKVPRDTCTQCVPGSYRAQIDRDAEPNHQFYWGMTHIHARGRMGARAAKMTHRLYLFAISIDLRSVKHNRATNDDVEGLCVLYRPQIDGSGE